MRKTVCSPKLETLESRQLLSTAKPTFDVWAISPTQVELSWSPVKNSTGYIVQEAITLHKFQKIHGRRVSVPVTEWYPIAQVGKGTTSYIVNGLTPSTTYTIDLASLMGRTQSQGVPKSVTTLCPAPAAPQWSTVNTTTTQATLQWGSVPGATSYLVYEYNASGWIVLGAPGSNITATTVTGLSPNTSYCFDVVALNSTGATWGTAAQVTTPQILATATPQWQITGVTSTTVSLQWGNGGATSYVVYEYTTNGWQALAMLNGSVLEYTATSLSPSTSYTFDVVACNAGGSTWGAAQSATTPQILASATPQWQITGVTSTTVSLQWGNGGATSYVVYEYTTNGWQALAMLNGSVLEYTATSLSPSTSYTFDVVACNAGGSTLGAAQSATTPQILASATPQWQITGVTSTTVSLQWGNGGATSYVVYEYTTNGWQALAMLNGSVLEYTATSLSPSTSYTFDVVACNAGGSTWGAARAPPLPRSWLPRPHDGRLPVSHPPRSVCNGEARVVPLVTSCAKIQPLAGKLLPRSMAAL